MALEVEADTCEAEADGEIRSVNENAGLNGRQGDDYGKDVCFVYRVKKICLKNK
jgi:hypothetical protein